MNRRKLTKTTEELQEERLIGDVGRNGGEIKRAVAELTRIVGGINVIHVQFDYEETDEGSDCRPEERKTKGRASARGREATTQSYRSVAIQTEVPHTQEEKSCLEQSELHTEWIRNRIVEGMNDTQVKKLITEHWPVTAYTSTTLCREGVLGAEVGDTRVVLVSQDKYSGSQ